MTDRGAMTLTDSGTVALQKWLLGRGLVLVLWPTGGVSFFNAPEGAPEGFDSLLDVVVWAVREKQKGGSDA